MQDMRFLLRSKLYFVAFVMLLLGLLCSPVVDAQCIRREPTLTITPESDSAVAGSAVSFSWSLTNNDIGCYQSVFHMTYLFEFYGTLPAASQTLQSGQTRFGTVVLSTPLTALPKSYPFTIIADDPTIGVHYITKTVEAILLPPSEQAPGAPNGVNVE